MRMITVAAGAALLILAASPAFAGGPVGGGRPGGGAHPGNGCGGCGGHPGYPGGGGRNININVNANASAYAGASARSYLNARAYNVGGARSSAGGGTVYVGGGYGGDAGAVYGGPVYYNEAVYEGRACGPAPFGYVLGGFGRDERYAPVCGQRYYQDADRGGRYGYSERRDSREESRYEESRFESYEEYGSFEARADYRDADHGRREERHEDRGDYVVAAREYDRGYMDGRRDCDCRADGRDGEPYAYPQPAPHARAPEPAPYDYAPEPPPAPIYEAPMTPNQYYGIDGETPPPPPPPPPSRRYSQEPGERG